MSSEILYLLVLWYEVKNDMAWISMMTMSFVKTIFWDKPVICLTQVNADSQCKNLFKCISFEVRLIFLPYCTVNLHPLFLFRKDGSVCDFEKKIISKMWTWKKQGKNRAIFIQKETRPGYFFSFWITMTPFFAPCFFQVLTWFFLSSRLEKNIRLTWYTRIVGANWLGTSIY